MLTKKFRLLVLFTIIIMIVHHHNNTQRERLTSISWFMGRLNEKIARMCNLEDGCAGRFWEGRYKCQALLDDGAILSAMTYVDLNPVRAKLAETPEESEFTSIYDRIKYLRTQLQNSKPIDSLLITDIDETNQPEELMKFGKSKLQNTTLDFSLSDYLLLVDTTGRLLREDKRGKIPDNLDPILIRLNIKPEKWLELISNFNISFSRAIGRSDKMSSFNHNKTKMIRGITKAKNYYLDAA